jgi:hypothetical protein
MSSFEVQCGVGEDRFCIEVPTDCSVGDVLKKASQHSMVEGISLWYSDIELNCDHLFADYFEPEAVYQIKPEGNYPEGTLLKSNEPKLKPLGVNPTAARLLMEMEKLQWSMDEFLEKANDFAPTLVLIKMKNGTECGGVAGVPWPKKHEMRADPAKGSFIFWLGANPARFDLVISERALFAKPWAFGFGGVSGDLFVLSDGSGCAAYGQGDYAGPREMGQLIGGIAEAYSQAYERWELWRL